MLNPGSKIFLVSEESDLQSLTEDVKRIHQQYVADYDALVDPRMVGMLYQIFTPAFVRKTGQLFYASHTEIFLVGPSMRTTFPVLGDSLRRLLQRL